MQSKKRVRFASQNWQIVARMQGFKELKLCFEFENDDDLYKPPVYSKFLDVFEGDDPIDLLSMMITYVACGSLKSCKKDVTKIGYPLKPNTLWKDKKCKSNFS